MAPIHRDSRSDPAKILYSLHKMSRKSKQTPKVSGMLYVLHETAHKTHISIPHSHLFFFLSRLLFLKIHITTNYNRKIPRTKKNWKICSNLPVNPLAHCLLSDLFHPAITWNTKHFDLLNEFIVIYWEKNKIRFRILFALYSSAGRIVRKFIASQTHASQ